jgi:hypothetical protein
MLSSRKYICHVKNHKFSSVTIQKQNSSELTSKQRRNAVIASIGGIVSAPFVLTIIPPYIVHVSVYGFVSAISLWGTYFVLRESIGIIHSSNSYVEIFFITFLCICVVLIFIAFALVSAGIGYLEYDCEKSKQLMRLE